MSVKVPKISICIKKCSGSNKLPREQLGEFRFFFLTFENLLLLLYGWTGIQISLSFRSFPGYVESI